MHLTRARLASTAAAMAIVAATPFATTSFSGHAAAAVLPSDPGAHFLLVSADGAPDWDVSANLYEATPYTGNDPNVVLHRPWGTNEQHARYAHWEDSKSSSDQKVVWAWLWGNDKSALDLGFGGSAGVDGKILGPANQNYCLRVNALGNLSGPVRTSTGDGRYPGSECTPD